MAKKPVIVTKCVRDYRCRQCGQVFHTDEEDYDDNTGEIVPNISQKLYHLEYDFDTEVTTLQFVYRGEKTLREIEQMARALGRREMLRKHICPGDMIGIADWIGCSGFKEYQRVRRGRGEKDLPLSSQETNPTNPENKDKGDVSPG